MYGIRFEENVEAELAGIRAFEARRILERIKGQLSHEPTHVTRNRKRLRGRVAPFRAVAPTWELRVGEYRVFYDVSEQEKVVVVRAVRRKPPDKTTEEFV